MRRPFRGARRVPSRSTVSTGDGVSPLTTRWVPGVAPMQSADDWAWIVDRLSRPGRDRVVVSDVVPEGFPRYVRLLHPCPEKPAWRWADVARARGFTAHPLMQWDALQTPDGSAGGLEAPAVGTIPHEIAAILTGVLSHHTSSKECNLAVWSGFAELPEGTVTNLALPDRSYVLLRAPIALAAGPLWTFEDGAYPVTQTANMWWPDDRSWVVATDIDFTFTLIGASSGCAHELVSHGVLEGYEVHAEDRVDSGGDTLNP